MKYPDKYVWNLNFTFPFEGTLEEKTHFQFDLNIWKGDVS